jgi:hypothetical protein
VKLGLATWSVIGTLVLTATLLAIFVGPVVLGSIYTRQVLAHGVPAPARILAMSDTGKRINQVPLIAIKVEVMPDDAPPYIAEFRRTLTLADADEFRRGNIIQVKYDPAHPQRVAAVIPAQ